MFRMIAAAAMLLAVLVPPAAAETKYVYSPSDGYLNLRTGPGTGFDVIRQMRNYSAVEILERSGTWARVRHESGDTGWASETFMVSQPVADDGRRRVHSPDDGYLNLRTGPGTGFAIVSQMPHGTTVTILERKGTWVRVRHASGDTGWAFARFLRR